jgi:flavorubredoxin
VTPEKLGDGVYRLTGGGQSYDSIIIDFRDYVMMLEAGGDQARATKYVAKTKELFPNKPIRYIMNTHPHSDHTGGLPVLVAEGATIIASKNSQEFFERALNTPRTLLAKEAKDGQPADALAVKPAKAKVEPVDVTVGDKIGKKVYTDGTHTVEFYHTWPVPHSNGLLVAFLPKEKVLFQGDFSLPNAGGEANDHIKALVPILEKLNLNFDRYINVHASATPQTKADLWKAVGK